MPLHVWPDSDSLADSIAAALIKRIKAFKPSSDRPTFVLGLCTGGTPEPLYARLVAAGKDRKFNMRQCSVVMLDEYVGTTRYRDFIHTRLLNTVSPADFSCPNGLAEDLEAECARYENMLRATKVDLWVTGVGRNGHIAFHEPGTDLGQGTHVCSLADETRSDNSRFEGETPRRALTVGVGSLMSHCAEVWVLATGDAKAQAVLGMCGGGSGDRLTPAAFVYQHHKVCQLHCDEAAAADLTVRTYKAALQVPSKRPHKRSRSAVRFNPERLMLGPASRLVVFSPHPDDECYAAQLMLHARAVGASVTVVWCTPGTGGLPPNMPRDTRYREGESALMELFESANEFQTVKLRLPFYDTPQRAAGESDRQCMADAVRRLRPTHVALCADCDPKGTHATVYDLTLQAVRGVRPPDTRVIEFVGAWPARTSPWEPNVWLQAASADKKRRMWTHHKTQLIPKVDGGDSRPLDQRYFDGLQDGVAERLRLL